MRGPIDAMLVVVLVLAGAASACEGSERDPPPDMPNSTAGNASLTGGSGGVPHATIPPEAPMMGTTPGTSELVDRAPTVPVLVSPEDGATEVETETALCWTASTDPEGDVLRYRVFVDGLELESGKVADDGFAGPCTEPLHFDPDRTFEWTVMAYEVDDTAVASARSAAWTFSTAREGGDHVVFEDDLEQLPALWEISGDATAGQWVWGTPEGQRDGGMQSQPDGCGDGGSCFFTGHNMPNAPSDEDVDGGSVVLVSPELDLTGAGSVTVSLSRFFYRGTSEDTGTRLQIELLAPDAAAPDGYRASVLEALDQGQASGANAWTAVAFAACDLPFGPGFKLRITATDPGDNIVEAAIDGVVVTAHEGAETCEHGVGALCDPSGSAGCDSGLLCCQTGTLNRGVYRCAEPAPAIDPDDPGSAGGPFTGETGCPLPDLTVVADLDTVEIDTRNFAAGACALQERCVGGAGMRRLLHFGMRTRNVGAADLVLGVPANRPDQYHYDSCHDHYHFEGFATYALHNEAGDVVARGAKIAQCVWDSGSWAWPRSRDGQYACYNQGITVGFEDEYDTTLDCQWIDITGVPPGDYTVAITINSADDGFSAPRLVERSYDNNVTTFPVTIP